MAYRKRVENAMNSYVLLANAITALNTEEQALHWRSSNGGNPFRLISKRGEKGHAGLFWLVERIDDCEHFSCFDGGLYKGWDDAVKSCEANWKAGLANRVARCCGTNTEMPNLTPLGARLIKAAICLAVGREIACAAAVDGATITTKQAEGCALIETIIENFVVSIASSGSPLRGFTCAVGPTKGSVRTAANETNSMDEHPTLSLWIAGLDNRSLSQAGSRLWLTLAEQPRAVA